MLHFFLSGCFFILCYGGIITNENDLDFVFSDTSSSGRDCGWAVENFNDPDIILPYPIEDGITGSNLPFNLLALYECASHNDRNDNSNDRKVNYNCRNNGRLRARAYDGWLDDVCPSSLIYTTQEQFSQHNIPATWSCGDDKCAAEVEYEVYDDINECSNMNPQERAPIYVTKYHVPLDSCIPFNGNYYEFRCGKDSNGNFCDANDYGTTGDSGCSNTLVLYQFTDSNCATTASFKVGFEQDSMATCHQVGTLYYDMEVDCPV